MGLTDPCMNFDIFKQLYKADRKLQKKKKGFTMNMYKDLFEHTCVMHQLFITRLENNMKTHLYF